MTGFEREARRVRLTLACRHLAADVDRDEHVTNIQAALDGPPFGAHVGWWRDNKHPHDRAAEIEEAWRFKG